MPKPKRVSVRRPGARTPPERERGPRPRARLAGRRSTGRARASGARRRGLNTGRREVRRGQRALRRTRRAARTAESKGDLIRCARLSHPPAQGRGPPALHVLRMSSGFNRVLRDGGSRSADHRRSSGLGLAIARVARGGRLRADRLRSPRRTSSIGGGAARERRASTSQAVATNMVERGRGHGPRRVTPRALRPPRLCEQRRPGDRRADRRPRDEEVSTRSRSEPARRLPDDARVIPMLKEAGRRAPQGADREPCRRSPASTAGLARRLLGDQGGRRRPHPGDAQGALPATAPGGPRCARDSSRPP